MYSFIRIFLVLGVLSSTCFGRDLYVSGRTGDDRNSGTHAKDLGSMDGPVRTVNRALKLAQAGDRIILDPKSEPYRETLTLTGKRLSGTADMPLILEGCGAILEGSEPIPPGVWQHFHEDVYRFQLTMQQVNTTFFHILDDTIPLKKAEVEPTAASIPELEPDSWCLFRGFVYFRARKMKSPIFASDYKLAYSERSSGISLIQAYNIRIHDLTIQGFQLDGISAVNGAEGVILDNVRCRANGRSGLAIGGASSVYAGYCKFEDNHMTQVLALPYSKGYLYDCGLAESDLMKAPQNAVVTLEKGENSQ